MDASDTGVGSCLKSGLKVDVSLLPSVIQYMPDRIVSLSLSRVLFQAAAGREGSILSEGRICLSEQRKGGKT